MNAPTVPARTEPSRRDLDRTEQLRAHDLVEDTGAALVGELCAPFTFDWATREDPVMLTFRHDQGRASVRVRAGWRPGDPAEVLVPCATCGNRVATGVDPTQHVTFADATAAAHRAANTSLRARLRRLLLQCAH